MARRNTNSFIVAVAVSIIVIVIFLFFQIEFFQLFVQFFQSFRPDSSGLFKAEFFLESFDGLRSKSAVKPADYPFRINCLVGGKDCL